MKFLVLLGSVFFSVGAFAGEIKCVLSETSDAKSAQQEMKITETSDPHGALVNFATEVFPGYTGFVALSKGFIIIHLYNTDTNAAISTAGTGDGNKYARLQYLLPGTGLNESIIIECQEK